jgi:hypothetical protein
MSEALVGHSMTAPSSFNVSENGVATPALGFGTSPMTSGVSSETIVTALKAGYRT